MSGVSTIKRHDDFYFRDGNICFLVENTRFRLHRYFFERESQYFRDLLNPSIAGEDGTHDSPYMIHDVKAEEFSQFVWLWYNPHYSFSGKGKEYWLTVLRLATQWQFQDIRNLAIRQLERLNLQPIEKIAIYKRFDVSPMLLLPSYMSLCRNEKLPSPAEGKVLSMETILKIASAREQILLTASESGCKTPTTASISDDVTKTIIAKLFELTFQPDETKGDASTENDVSVRQQKKSQQNGNGQSPNGVVHKATKAK